MVKLKKQTNEEQKQIKERRHIIINGVDLATATPKEIINALKKDLEKAARKSM